MVALREQDRFFEISDLVTPIDDWARRRGGPETRPRCAKSAKWLAYDGYRCLFLEPTGCIARRWYQANAERMTSHLRRHSSLMAKSTRTCRSTNSARSLMVSSAKTDASRIQGRSTSVLRELFVRRALQARSRLATVRQPHGILFRRDQLRLEQGRLPSSRAAKREVVDDQ